MFKSWGLISALSFVDDLETACKGNSIHKGTATCLFQRFIGEHAMAALSHGVKADKKNRQQEEKLPAYFEVVNYVLKTYATHHFITNAEANIISFKKPTCLSFARHFGALGEQAHICGIVYNEPRFKEFFIEDLYSSIRYSMQTYCGEHKEASLYCVARHVRNTMKLQEGCHSPTTLM